MFLFKPEFEVLGTKVTQRERTERLKVMRGSVVGGVGQVSDPADTVYCQDRRTGSYCDVCLFQKSPQGQTVYSSQDKKELKQI